MTSSVPSDRLVLLPLDLAVLHLTLATQHAFGSEEGQPWVPREQLGEPMVTALLLQPVLGQVS